MFDFLLFNKRPLIQFLMGLLFLFMAGGIVCFMIHGSLQEGGDLHVPVKFQHGWRAVVWLMMILVGVFCSLLSLFMLFLSPINSIKSDGSFGGKEDGGNYWYL